MSTSPRPVDVPISGQLRLWDHGGEGPPVLFVHGFLDTGRSYDDACALLGDDARCLCLDWRGHGQSGPVGDAGYHLLDHVKDLARVVAWLGEGGLGEPAPPELLVAHSMGGNAALLLAGSRPEQVRRLLLLDAIGAPAEAPEEQPERLGRLLAQLGPKRPFRAFSTREEAIERILATNHGLSRAAAERMARGGVIERDGQHTFAFDPGLRGPNPLRFPEPFWTTLCGRIEAPVLLLRAEQGYVPDEEPVAGRVGALRKGKLETVPGVGHHLHVEVPEKVAEAVREMLALPAVPLDA